MKGSVPFAQAIEEAAGRCVEVAAAHWVVPGDAEAVNAVARGGQEEARMRDVGIVAGTELDLAFEDVERIHVVGVGVRVDALEVGREGELERLDVRQLRENAVLVPSDALALARPDEVRLVHRSAS
jgi:hypothetical protein